MGSRLLIAIHIRNAREVRIIQLILSVLVGDASVLVLRLGLVSLSMDVRVGVSMAMIISALGTPLLRVEALVVYGLGVVMHGGHSRKSRLVKKLT